MTVQVRTPSTARRRPGSAFEQGCHEVGVEGLYCSDSEMILFTQKTQNLFQLRNTPYILCGDTSSGLRHVLSLCNIGLSGQR